KWKDGEITTQTKKSIILYGYKYKGKQVLKNNFEQIDPFSHNITRVKQNGKWGFINYKGEIIVKPNYKDALPVCGTSYGRAFVYDKKDNLWKMVDDFGLS